MLTLRSGALRLLTLALAGCLSFGAARAEDDNDRDNSAYNIGMWGDLPYSEAQETTGLPNLIADMNAARLKFTVHNGDLKQGSNSLCNEALYSKAKTWFNSLNGAAMFTPGDNDWTDCDRPSNGGFDSLGRLELERATFFNNYYSLGKRPIAQEVQTAKLCLGVDPSSAALPAARIPAACVENRRWTVGRVTYVTLNVAGSCNNLCDTAAEPAEYAARNAANIKWLRDSFAIAKARGSVAVMLISQANPGWDQTDPTRAPLRDPKTLVETDPLPDGFKDFLTALRAEVVAFARPVAYVHGDSHYFRVDKPFLDLTGKRLENFTRVETFGNNAGNGVNDVHWVKVTVDPKSRDVFAYTPMMVPGNRVAVPAP